jgi:hypothetical protein
MTTARKGATVEITVISPASLAPAKRSAHRLNSAAATVCTILMFPSIYSPFFLVRRLIQFTRSPFRIIDAPIGLLFPMPMTMLAATYPVRVEHSNGLEMMQCQATGSTAGSFATRIAIDPLSAAKESLHCGMLLEGYCFVKNAAPSGKSGARCCGILDRNAPHLIKR